MCSGGVVGATGIVLTLGAAVVSGVVAAGGAAVTVESVAFVVVVVSSVFCEQPAARTRSAASGRA